MCRAGIHTTFTHPWPTLTTHNLMLKIAEKIAQFEVASSVIRLVVFIIYYVVLLLQYIVQRDYFLVAKTSLAHWTYVSESQYVMS